MTPEEWKTLFALETPILELVVRATVLYFVILGFMRFLPRRTGGELATMDLVFVVLVAEGAAHSLGEYKSLPDGLVVVTVLMAWNYLLNLLSFRIRIIERVLSAPPLQVIRDGQLLRRNMRRELLTLAELMAHLREQGVDDVRSVKAAFVEGEGQLTVILREPK